MLHVDEQRRRLLLFYSESKLCVRKPAVTEPSGENSTKFEYGDRYLPGGDLKMTSLKVSKQVAVRKMTAFAFSPSPFPRKQHVF